MSANNLRYAVTLIGIGFAMGAAFQLGISLVSHINPRVEVIEIRTTSEPAPKG
ncbi:MAG: hypothetical protein ABN479_19760 [Billgrantia sp.]